jgi:cytochrome c553
MRRGCSGVTHQRLDWQATSNGRSIGYVTCLILLLTWNAPSAAQGLATAGQAKAASCAACHGTNGNSINPLWPSLAGQHAGYIAHQLVAFQQGTREDVLMTSFAASLSAEDIADLAAYFENQTVTPKGADPAVVDAGARIYRSGIPDRGVPACIACHGPTGRGNPLAAYPALTGQHATYVVNTLRAYSSGARRSDGAVNLMMRDLAALLREDEMQAVASYVQGLR